MIKKTIAALNEYFKAGKRSTESQLGDFKLLQKIEKLTLYIISLKKEIGVLQRN
ncbi:hypothetical protein ACNFU2_07680 [Chryseobacterium sp. PTM-20240506]|uniref:hypothetical protein n=1 Tax=unclassified Chryseobacterium TaxID=2593645 RepID=UPI00235A25BC|nr:MULTISPECIES: hypothetical protein [unclassified Chryseobacterium]MDC8104675.1 hypothetical protein [Chryseobacterium sp. B21-037]MDQ1806215.1 hypothetical protein [Chryseobacterium sp. CKR4-1]